MRRFSKNTQEIEIARPGLSSIGGTHFAISRVMTLSFMCYLFVNDIDQWELKYELLHALLTNLPTDNSISAGDSVF